MAGELFQSWRGLTGCISTGERQPFPTGMLSFTSAEVNHHTPTCVHLQTLAAIIQYIYVYIPVLYTIPFLHDPILARPHPLSHPIEGVACV